MLSVLGLGNTDEEEAGCRILESFDGSLHPTPHPHQVAGQCWFSAQACSDLPGCLEGYKGENH